MEKRVMPTARLSGGLENIPDTNVGLLIFMQ